MAVRLICAVVVIFVAVECVVITGKAYFCRDPDTGKLHAVNSTWESRSFCGNYTCKIRRRNNTSLKYTVLRQINITNVPLPTNMINKFKFTPLDDKSNITQDIQKVEGIVDSNKVNIITVELDNTQNLGILPMEGKTNLKIATNYYNNNDTLKQNNKDKAPTKHTYGDTKGVQKEGKYTRKTKDDRLLTEHEIKAISDILHSVKKSELDAIVDIYNLAQEIYSEVETSTAYDIDEPPSSTTDDKNTKIKSYWYDPYYKGLNLADQGMSDIGTHTTIKPKKNLFSFFTGSALSDNDFRRLPYPYPHPNTQKSAAYFIEPPTTVKAEPPKSCKKKQGTNINIQNSGQPSYLLPYPFAYIHQYHLPTDYPKGLLYDIPYTWDYNRAKKIPQYSGYLNDIVGRKAVLINPHLQEQPKPLKHDTISAEPPHKNGLDQIPIEESLLRRLIMKTKNEDQEWHQRSDKLRGKMNTTRILKSFPPLPKKINIDNVEKVSKIDTLSRKRREVEKTPDPISEEEGTHETYLERTTCAEHTEPGFFRVGNLSQPYPACCPQLINNR